MKQTTRVLVVIIVIVLIAVVVAVAMGWVDVSRWVKVWSDQKISGKNLQDENKKLRERLILLEQQLESEKELRLQLEQELAVSEQEKLPEGKEMLGEKEYRELGNYYAGMKAPTAAAILGKMAPGVVAEILMGMDKEEAGEILAALEPEMAVQVTEMIAGSAAQDVAQERDR
ncbi:MAG TPA: hypothetical protein GXX59_07035 [Syntrophomonadaceae bacterium]|nr:hypothetical protein [Syntrophomonadaceae bacterium]